jgi:hypothetical protein
MGCIHFLNFLAKAEQRFYFFQGHAHANALKVEMGKDTRLTPPCDAGDQYKDRRKCHRAKKLFSHEVWPPGDLGIAAPCFVCRLYTLPYFTKVMGCVSQIAATTGITESGILERLVAPISVWP